MDDGHIRTIAGLFCRVTGLMGWPVWSVGVLPSVNGSVLAQPTQVPMIVDRTEMTHKSKSRGYSHWAWLRTDMAHASVGSGRYVISDEVYQRLNRTAQRTVKVTAARGFLGTQVVIGFE